MYFSYLFLDLIFLIYIIKSLMRTILIVGDSKIIDEFKIQSFEYFRVNGNLSDFSYANYTRVIIDLLETYFKQMYSQIQSVTEDDIKFYRSNRKDAVIPERYNVSTSSKVTLLLEKEFVDRFYNIMNTYYRNEILDVSFYGFSMFIVDLLPITKMLLF